MPHHDYAHVTTPSDAPSRSDWKTWIVIACMGAGGGGVFSGAISMANEPAGLTNAEKQTILSDIQENRDDIQNLTASVDASLRVSLQVRCMLLAERDGTDPLQCIE